MVTKRELEPFHRKNISSFLNGNLKSDERKSIVEILSSIFIDSILCQRTTVILTFFKFSVLILPSVSSPSLLVFGTATRSTEGDWLPPM